jgi:hypothetical protein
MKPQFISLLSLLFIFFVTGSISAQVDSTKKTGLKHSMGAAAGLTTGYGLSYRFWPGTVGVQLAFAPTSNSSQSRISSGLTLLFKLVGTERANLFLYQGNHLLYHYMEYGNYFPSRTSYKEYNLYNGIGLGIEFIIVKRISFNLMGGYAAYESFKSLGLTGETGLFFKF